VLVLSGLRVTHLAAGYLHPAVLTGPVRVSSIDEIERYAGFAPWIPFFRPISTGAGPPSIVVTRRSSIRVDVEWSGDRLLRVTMLGGDLRPDVPAEATKIEGEPDSAVWSEDGMQHALVLRDGLWIRIVTDLPERSARRVAVTLRER
jgi:hypothetical protein